MPIQDQFTRYRNCNIAMDPVSYQVVYQLREFKNDN